MPTTWGPELRIEREPEGENLRPQGRLRNLWLVLPSSFYRKDQALPPEMRYYDGKPPEITKFGTAWQGGNVELIDKPTEIGPGIILIALVSDSPGTKELLELDLAVNTSEGIVLVVGCSHPGIE